MQVLVMSDSHGDEAAVRYALAAHPQVQAVIHLGDGAAEARRVADEDASRPWYIIGGNCDYDRDLPARLVMTLGGAKLYLTHGYAERVKSGLLNLALSARSQEAVAALYGHTHVAATDFDNGVLLFNPGSIGAGSYGVLTIEQGVVRSSLYRTR